MGIQQEIKTYDHYADNIAPDISKTCISIIWVKSASNELDKMRLIQSLKKMTGVVDASFTRETPAIVMVNYCNKETSAVDVAKGISGLGIFARRVGC